jgi:predicted TIM-barrel fold metal-dependent hydrolase
MFDSSAHPTLDGQWIGGRVGLTHDNVADELLSVGYAGALAIGLPGVGNYSHAAYWEACARHESLVAVAGLTTASSLSAAAADLDVIAGTGFSIVKIHPRLLGYEQTLALLPALMAECRKRKLAVILCTYPEYRSPISADDAREAMAEGMAALGTGHCIALHSGVLDPSPFAALVQDNPNLLLDFSLSLLKYPEEVQPLVVELAKEYPGNVALGSDGPEWTYEQVAAGLEGLRSALSASEVEALGGGNLRTWLSSLPLRDGV